jgi:very-short-patch-repair endonuclease
VEVRLWRVLRGRQLGGFKFLRQEPIGPYFADFACREARLVIELDGSQHADSDYDARRDTFLVSRGYRVLRIWNNEVLTNLTGVADAILAALAETAPHPGR